MSSKAMSLKGKIKNYAKSKKALRHRSYYRIICLNVFW